MRDVTDQEIQGQESQGQGGQGQAAVLDRLEPAVREFVGRLRVPYIDGQEAQPRSGQQRELKDPGTGQPVARVVDSDEEDVAAAVAAARRAFEDGPWTRMKPADREAVLHRLADLIDEHAEELAQLEVLNTGKPLANARGEMRSGAGTFRYFAGWPTKLMGETNPTSPEIFSYTSREPVGVCGLITAWNFPFSLACWKLASALACGNTAVLKPAEHTPLTTLRLAALATEAGIPPGVVNTVPGDGRSGRAVVRHPDVAKISFTGSTAVGRSIMVDAADKIGRVTLELGGKSPNIVFADADPEVVAAAAARSIFGNAGQVCTAGSRLLVAQQLHDEVVDGIVARAGKLRLGHGLDPDSQMGPLISEEHRQRVLGYVESGSADGASLRTGGEALEIDGGGFFFAPTVFTGIDNGMRIAQEEVFGPVLSVIPFDEEEQLVRLANDTTYGLAAYVWTRDVARAHRVAKALRAGTVWVNSPGGMEPSVSFGGFKQSGFGRELGPHSIEAYTELKSVYINTVG